MSISYGVTWPLVTHLDGTLYVDFSQTISGPQVVAQRFLNKIMAAIGAFWWMPRVGTNLAFTKGRVFSKSDISNLENLIILQGTSDPQIDPGSVTAKVDFTNEVLTVSTSIMVSGTTFTPSIVISAGGIKIAVGAPNGG